jgi:hypothetical protein
MVQKRVTLLNTKSLPKPFKYFSCKRLGEAIGNLICGLNEFQSSALNLSLPPALDFHMLSAGVVLPVQGQSDGSLVVTVDDRCSVCSCSIY